MPKNVKVLWRKRGGYGVVQLIILIVVICGLSIAFGSAFKTALSAAANHIGDKITEYIN